MGKFGTHTCEPLGKTILKEGTYIITFDSDIREGYLAIVMEDNPDFHRKTTLCKVLRMMHYPHQGAILQDTIYERPPIPEGTVCRLPYGGLANRCDIESTQTYADSVNKCLERYRANVAHYADWAICTLKDPRVDPDGIAADNARRQIRFRDEVLAILARHAAGEYGHKRILLTK